MKVKPLGNRVLVRKIEEEERRTPGGIVLPESDVKEGDKVLISAYAGTEIRMGEEKYLLVKSNDILAVIEE